MMLRLVPVVVASAAVLITLWSVRVPGGYLGAGLLAVACWLVAALAWLVLLGWEIAAWRRGRRGRGVPWVLTVPVLLAGMAALVVPSQLVARATFAVHRDAFERLVTQPPQQPARRIGLYEVGGVARIPGAGDCTKIDLPGAGWASTGFAHCPGGPPVDDPGNEGNRFRPLSGDWYVVRFIW